MKKYLVLNGLNIIYTKVKVNYYSLNIIPKYLSHWATNYEMQDTTRQLEMLSPLRKSHHHNLMIRHTSTRLTGTTGVTNLLLGHHLLSLLSLPRHIYSHYLLSLLSLPKCIYPNPIGISKIYFNYFSLLSNSN